jgi:hypothetical protein
MSDSIPVIIYHCGGQPYLKLSVASAEKNSSKFILLGNKQNKTFSRCWSDMNTLDQSKYLEFEKCYTHMSTHDKAVDLIIFKKYYTVREYMKQNQENACFILDADVLLYERLDKSDFVDRAYAAVSMPEYQDGYAWAASPHVSFWTYNALCDFTDYMISVYQNKQCLDYCKLVEKYDYQKRNKQSGGICDMTLLYLWANQREKVFNTCKVIDDRTFEHCMTIPDNYLPNEYQMNHKLGIKRVEFENGVPYLLKQDGSKIRTPILHFQGNSKAYMATYISGKNKIYLQKMLFSKYTFLLERVIRKVPERLMK